MQWAVAAAPSPSMRQQPSTVPVLPAGAGKLDGCLLIQLRRFYLGDPQVQIQPPGEDYLPALLAAYRDGARLRYGYPLFLYAPEGAATDPLIEPLSELLKRQLDALAPGADQARILKDNLSRLEAILRQALAPTAWPVAAAALVKQAGQVLQDALNLKPGPRDHLQADLDRLCAALPAEGQLLGYGGHVAVHLLLHVARRRLIPRYRQLSEEIGQLLQHLQALLDVEWNKSAAAREPGAVADSVGVAGSRFLDPAALARIMGQARGGRPMAVTRRARIEAVLPVLEAFQARTMPMLATFVHAGSLAADWLQNLPACTAVSVADPCAEAAVLFDAQAGEFAQVFRAVRIARLEVAGGYDPDRHDPWFAAFNWEAFSRDELLLVPPVVALEAAAAVAGDRLPCASRLLNSGRPVQIFLDVCPGLNPANQPGEEPLANYQLELGYLGIAHRQATVQQASIARPQQLLEGLLAALDGARAGMHLIDSGLHANSAVLPWLAAGAAVEGRAHPLLRFVPQAGADWAARMDFAGNPQPTADWPVYPFQYRDAKGTATSIELAFTFADFALLEPGLRKHFCVIPAALDAPELIPLTESMSRETEPDDPHIPYIWAVDAAGGLHRIAVSRQLVAACRDRRDYWRTLQELAGVRNKYVELAQAQVRAEAVEAAVAARERLQTEHAAALDRVRNETAGEAMQRLTQVLLGMDLLTAGQTLVSAPKPPPSVPPVAKHKAEAKAPVPKAAPPKSVPPADSAAGEEPWIDSGLCTSCNECTNRNPLLFVYNENKQAVIGDSKAGTYAQLVAAAEACPSRCIHPGKPLNPAEPGLEALIQRAAPLN